MSEFILGVAVVIVGEVILAITLVIWKADWRRRTWNKIRFGTCICGYPMTMFGEFADQRLLCPKSDQYSLSSRNPHERYTLKHCSSRWRGLIVRPMDDDPYVQSERKRISER